MAKIGVIDSGYGGLSFIKAYAEFGKQNHTFVYAGDNKRAPYGVRSIDELYRFATELIDYLIMQQVECIVIACGTIATNLLTRLKSHYTLPIYGISQQLFEHERSWKAPVGVIATKKTVSSQYFQNYFTNLGVESIVIATQPFVGMVEKTEAISDEKVAQALERVQSCQSLILGCTHFPFLAKEIQKHLQDVELIDPALSLVEVMNQLQSESIQTFQYVTSGKASDFEAFLIQNQLPKGVIQHEDFARIK